MELLESIKPAWRRLAAALGFAMRRPVGSFMGGVPSRGRHQSTSKECQQVLKKIEALDGVLGAIIGRSYGGKSLGRTDRTGAVRIQRRQPGGLKGRHAVRAKGLQELFIRVAEGREDAIEEAIERLG
jgi:hypothetical protein